MKFFQWLSSLDRRVIFLFLAIALLFPLFFPFQQKVQITNEVRNFYNTIESLPEGAVVAVSFDYGPSAAPEVLPMSLAAIDHIFRRNLKLITLALWPDGEPYSITSADSIAQKYHKTYGVDYVTLGYKPGLNSVILQMGENIHEAYPTDSRRQSIADLPLMARVKKYEDIHLLIDLAAGDSPDRYVALAVERYHVALQVGCTAVMAANFFPYLQTQQLRGLLPGLKAASEYEYLLYNANTPLTGGMMGAQSLVHLLMILFILLGNIGYFVMKAYAKKP